MVALVHVILQLSLISFIRQLHLHVSFLHVPSPVVQRPLLFKHRLTFFDAVAGDDVEEVVLRWLNKAPVFDHVHVIVLAPLLVLPLLL